MDEKRWVLKLTRKRPRILFEAIFLTLWSGEKFRIKKKIIKRFSGKYTDQ